jgi:hypothetical protein
MARMLENPIQCPDDLDGYSYFNRMLARRAFDCEPSDDFDQAKHDREGHHLLGYTDAEIKECQIEVATRLAAQAAHNAEIERGVERMRKIWSKN